VKGWIRRMVRYMVAAGGLAIAMVVLGSSLVGPEGQRGLMAAAIVALAVQIPSFGILAATQPGSARYLAVWLGSTLVRFGVIAAFAFAIAGTEGVDLVVSLVALAGLLLIMLLLEPWALQGGADGNANG